MSNEPNITDEFSEELFERWKLQADRGQAPLRVDKFVVEHMGSTSRNRIQAAADAGHLWVNGKAVKANYKVKPLDIVQVLLDHEPIDFTIEPEDIPKACKLLYGTAVLSLAVFAAAKIFILL